MTTATPFFILGADRSGTTLLRSLLMQRYEVAIPPESEFIRDLASWRLSNSAPALRDIDRLVTSIARHPRVLSWGLPREWRPPVPEPAAGRPAIFRSAIAQPFEQYASQHGVEAWGDKTPSYLTEVELLNELWPHSRFVFMERDGRDVFASVRHLPFGANTAGAAAHTWLEAVLIGDATRERYPDRTMTVRYEDLVVEPVTVADGLAAWLELRPRQQVRDPEAAVDPARADWFTRLHDRIDAQSVGRWHRDLTPREVAVYEETAGATLLARGYALSGPSTRSSVIGKQRDRAIETWLRLWHFAVLRLWRERGREVAYVVRRRLKRL